jgi:O-antigen/teichoic acid export membrane protein
VFGKVASLIRVVLSKAPDTSTAQGRSQDRYRRAALTGLADIVARGVNIGIGIVTVPLTLSYLGADRYGLWMVLTSSIAFLTFTDMGLSIGLLNALSNCHGRDDRLLPRRFVSSAMLALASVAVLLVLVAIYLLPLLPLSRLVKMESATGLRELLPTTQAMLIMFALGLPTGVIQSVYKAYQEGYKASLWLASGRIAAFAGVLVCVVLKLGLPALAAAVTGLPFVMLWISGLFLFRRRAWLSPRPWAVSWRALKATFGRGMMSVLAQVGAVMLFSGPALVIANRLGAVAVTPFSVTQKLLSTMGILLSSIVMPLWPAYGEAKARGEWSWAKKTYWQSLQLGILIQASVFLVLTVLGRPIIRLWTGRPEAVPTFVLFMSINVWFLVTVLKTCTSIALNGLDHMIGQAFYNPLLALAGLAAGYWLVPYFGELAVVWSILLLGSLGMGLANIIELAWVFKCARHRPPATPTQPPSAALDDQGQWPV